MRKILLAFFIFSLLILSGCGSKSDYQPGIQGDAINQLNNAPKTSNIEILTHKLRASGNEYFMTYSVEGTAKNTGSERVSYAQINVRFYDKNNVMIGNSLDNAADIDPGITFSFKVMYLGEGIPDHYDIAVENIAL